MATLANIVSEVRQLVDPSELLDEPYVGLEHLLPNEREIPVLGYASDVRSQKLRFRRGDILFGRLRPYLRKVALAPTDGVCSTDILVLRPKPTVHPAFAYYVLASPAVLRHGVAMSAGTRMPRVSARSLLLFDAPTPTQAVQARIASLGQALDDARVVARRSLVASERLLAATLAQCFADTSRSWSRAMLSDVADTRSGSTPKSGEDRYWLAGTVPFLKSADLNDGVVSVASDRVTQDAVVDYRLRLYPRGTVLVAMYGVTRGKLGLLDIEAAGNQAILAITPDTTRVTSSFLFCALLAQQRELVRAGVGGAQQNLSGQMLRKRTVAFPSLREQEQLVRLFDAMACDANALRRTLDGLGRSRSGLVEAVVTTRVEPGAGLKQHLSVSHAGQAA